MHNPEKEKKKGQSFPSLSWSKGVCCERHNCGNVLFVMSQWALTTPQGWRQHLSQVLVPTFGTVLFLSHSNTWKVHRSVSFNGKLSQRICARDCKHKAKYAVLEISR